MNLGARDWGGPLALVILGLQMGLGKHISG